MRSREDALEIRRKFLEDIRRDVDANLQTQLGHVAGKRAIAWIVHVPDGLGRRVADDFRSVELSAARIRVRPEDLTDRVSNFAQPCPVPRRK